MLIKKVLLVDDDFAIRRVAEICLTKVGHWETRTASSAAMGLETLDDFQPDVILLDVMMPDMDGPSALPLLRKKAPNVPVIFITAKVMKHEVERYLSLGAAGVLSKPFDPLLLPSEIEAIVHKASQKPVPVSAH